MLHGLLIACELVLFGYGLRHCGPLRAILLDSALFALRHQQSQGRHPHAVGWRRGGQALLALALLLLLGTHGIHPHRLRSGSADTQPPSEWPEHALGEAALLAASGLAALRSRGAQHLAQTVGGPRRLFALTSAAAALILLSYLSICALLMLSPSTLVRS